ncbi:MauE/DoxX family redox-associated membrane protein, partial [Xanthomarina gelatinilytica]|uniref:MauE/DoxX family redox-associated membrane protein n=1 Tax=Xanthomarina gelatinilytica TaxID=1137281 RepID=UPI003AA8DE19
VFERFRIPALFAAFALMVMFTAYIVIILNFSDFIPCSCGGVLEKLSWTQHLIFNIAFIILAGVAVFLVPTHSPKRIVLLLVSLAIMGIGIVTLLFVFSEKKMHRNNAFQRRYMPHPLIKIGEYDLEKFGHYIAGVAEDAIYLGDYTAPLYLRAIDTTLKEMREFRVTISNTDLPYRRAKITVQPPYFYLGDGTVPVLFKGKMNSWSANPFSYEEAYFTQYTVADSLLTGFITTSSKTGSNAIGIFDKRDSIDTVQLNIKILGKEKYGKIKTDGNLLYNPEFQKFIYLYYYINKYELLDKQLTHELSGKTIDTISKPILDIAHNSKKGETKVGGKSVLVNLQSTTSGNYLYIHSNRLGKYEDDRILNTASIIDVYDLRDYTYAFSFYLFHQRDEKLTEIQVNKDLLVAIVGDKLWLYRLKPAYFETGPNPTHTAQYQEKDRTPVKNSRSLIH